MGGSDISDMDGMCLLMAIDKLVDSAQLESDLTSVANAIRAKTGGTADLAFPADFVSEIGSISGGGGYTIDDVIEHDNYIGNITYTGTHVIPPAAFFGATGLTGFSAPNVTAIDGSSYGIGNSDSRVFQGCTNLESISLPKVKSFYYAGYSFDGCHKITNWDLAFDSITIFGGSVFRNSSFPSAVFKAHPENNNIYTYCFSDCDQMEYIDLKCRQFQTGCFAGTGMRTIVLRNTSSVASLQNINVFNGTPFADGGTGGTLYVLSDKIASYQSATNWSTILGYANNQILPIEGSIYETQYADGTPIPTA